MIDGLKIQKLRVELPNQKQRIAGAAVVGASIDWTAPTLNLSSALTRPQTPAEGSRSAFVRARGKSSPAEPGRIHTGSKIARLALPGSRLAGRIARIADWACTRELDKLQRSPRH